MLLLTVVVGLVLTCIFVKESEEDVSCVGKFLGRVGAILLSAGGFLMLCVTLFPMLLLPSKNVSDEIASENQKIYEIIEPYLSSTEEYSLGQAEQKFLESQVERYISNQDKIEHAKKNISFHSMRFWLFFPVK